MEYQIQMTYEEEDVASLVKTLNFAATRKKVFAVPARSDTPCLAF